MFLSLPNYFIRFLYPPDAPATPAAPPSSGLPGGDDKESVIDFLAQDDEKPEVLDITEKGKKKTELPEGSESKTGKDTKEKGTKEDEETDEDDEVDKELKDLEDELEEPTEEQLELVTPVRRREILKKYPELFKDFPYLEKAYYREQQFTNILGTIDDAKYAVEQARILNAFEGDIAKGDTHRLLTQVKNEAPEAFATMVDNYLPTLQKVDENAYLHVIGNVTKHTIMTMIGEAKRSKNANLQAAAHILNQFVFGTSDWHPPTNLSKGVKPEEKASEDRVSAREREITERQFRGTVEELNIKVNNTLKSTIDAHIDPSSSMSDYVRKNASREAMETLENLISKDSRFKTLTDKMWNAAMQSGFDKTSVDRIKSAYLSKAKSLLPSVIKKARTDALRGASRKTSDETESDGGKKGPVTPGRPRSSSPSGKVTKASEIPKGMSSLDFLNSD